MNVYAKAAYAFAIAACAVFAALTVTMLVLQPTIHDLRVIPEACKWAWVGSAAVALFGGLFARQLERPSFRTI